MSSTLLVESPPSFLDKPGKKKATFLGKIKATLLAEYNVFSSLIMYLQSSFCYY